jgi:hypothetical protein
LFESFAAIHIRGFVGHLGRRGEPALAHGTPSTPERATAIPSQAQPRFLKTPVSALVLRSSLW